MEKGLVRWVGRRGGGLEMVWREGGRVWARVTERRVLCVGRAARCLKTIKAIGLEGEREEWGEREEREKRDQRESARVRRGLDTRGRLAVLGGVEGGLQWRQQLCRRLQER